MVALKSCSYGALIACLAFQLACQSSPEETQGDPAGPSASSSATTGGGGGSGGVPAGPPSVRVGTWNLHNFSVYGQTEFRIGDIADKISALDADILGVQELKIVEDSMGQGTQAWDVLLEQLPDYAGLHNPWPDFDSVVGLLYKPETTEVKDSRALFENDGYAFPRAPLEVDLVVGRR